MPRLSIIVPHRRDDSRLEATLISILQSRPDDSEVIVVHDGSYSDPYELRDEVIFVEEDAGCPEVQLLNAGLLAACSPVVNIVLDGTEVTKDWYLEPLDLFCDESVSSVSVNVVSAQGSGSGAAMGLGGIVPLTRVRTGNLMRGQVQQRRSNAMIAGPALSCGFYRRKQLLALHGWNSEFSLMVADVELAWVMQSLGLTCTACVNAAVQGPLRSIDAQSVRELAELAVAFGIAAPGALSAVSDFARGALSGKVAAATSWFKGLTRPRLVGSVTKRLGEARRGLEQLESERIVAEEQELRIYPEAAASYRRAA